MIANVKATEGIGTDTIKKRIHAGSESIMFSVLQATQYMYPYKSAVREIVSNSIDSVNERNNSIKILHGELEISDIYIEKKGDAFKESVFDADYYDEKWLSSNDKVIIEYIEHDTDTRDRIRFIDEGVGLGGSRLINMFGLGFSTKRNSKSQAGNFGLGSKSLLSTGIDYYTMTSRYNGRVYSFNIYKDHISPAISKFNEDGSMNQIETFIDASGDEHLIYYQETKEKNGVIVEAEVKRHRKQDYVSGIKSQLGFIDNVVFQTKYGRENTSPTVSNIRNKVVYSTDNLIVGEADYYAVPQIILTPGEDSNVFLNYGKINWEELEMKKYPGNVCFIMDINKVDVTPSRESVIYNSRTRGAITKMIEIAQKTVGYMIAKEIKGAKCLPDHMALFEGIKSNSNAVPGLSELYKIVDISSISAKYKTFRLGTAAKQLENRKIEKEVLFTKTDKPNGYGSNRQTGDTNYNSALTRSFLASMSSKASDTVTLFVGTTRYKHLARYVNHVRNLGSDDVINIIWMKDDIYEFYKEKVDSKGLDFLVKEAYKNGKMDDVLILEAIRLSMSNPNCLLLDIDVDKTKMGSLEKEEEQKKSSNGYMKASERAKLDGKVIGNYHHSVNGTSRDYYREETLDMGSKAFIYNMGDGFLDKMFRESRSYSSLSGYNIIGFSDENFKRFYKHPNTELLVDNLFTIKFGVLRFTRLGKLMLSRDVMNYVTTNYTYGKNNESLLSGAYSFLNNQFSDTDIEDSDYEGVRDEIVNRKKQRIKDKYLNINN